VASGAAGGVCGSQTVVSRSTTWHIIQADLQQTLDRCRTLNLDRFVDESRFVNRATRLQSLISALADGRPALRQLVETDPVAYMVALAEAAEISYILPFLRTCDPEPLRPKLRDILKGPPLPSDEDQNSSQARNIMFELNLACRLWRAGLSPRLGEHPDLSCIVNGRRLLIQCKRPGGLSGTRNAVSRARVQLTDDLRTASDDARGVIAISLAKLINPRDLAYVYEDEHRARGSLAARLHEEADSFRDAWDVSRRHIIGLVFHSMTPGVENVTGTGVLFQHNFVRSLSRHG
jgi:hypothetical protein